MEQVKTMHLGKFFHPHLFDAVDRTTLGLSILYHNLKQYIRLKPELRNILNEGGWFNTLEEGACHAEALRAELHIPLPKEGQIVKDMPPFSKLVEMAKRLADFFYSLEAIVSRDKLSAGLAKTFGEWTEKTIPALELISNVKEVNDRIDFALRRVGLRPFSISRTVKRNFEKGESK